VSVRGGMGQTIVCDSGTVWVTQDGDPRDVILSAGRSFTIDRIGTALMQAFEPSSIRIAGLAAQSSPGVPDALPRRVVAGAVLGRGALSA
jgi:hypothetical protein